MTLTLDDLSATGMFQSSSVDTGPFECPACGAQGLHFRQTLEGWCEQCGTMAGIPFHGPGTKVLVVGDTNGVHHWMRTVVIPYAQTMGCTAIIQVGDFGFVWDNAIAIVNRELDALHKELDAAGLTLTFLPGHAENHMMLHYLAEESDRTEDGHFLLRPTIRYTGRVTAWTWSGLRMAAVGGGASIDRANRVKGVSWWPQETLQPQEVASATRLGPVDILFSHDAPAGVPVPTVPDITSAVHRSYMSAIGEALRPALWFHGHYRESILYKFRHPAGQTTVRGLHCNQARQHRHSMVAINLHAIRDGMEHFRPGRG